MQYPMVDGGSVKFPTGTRLDIDSDSSILGPPRLSPEFCLNTMLLSLSMFSMNLVYRCGYAPRCSYLDKHFNSSEPLATY